MFDRIILAITTVLGLVLGLMIAPAGPAAAVTNGTPDTSNRFPYVGTIVLRIGESGSHTYHYWCSGTLVAAGGARSNVAVALVANGHCFDNSFQQASFPGSTQLGVTVSTPISTTSAPPASELHIGTGFIDPGYPQLPDDVGVYVLAQPFNVGVPLPRLPAIDELTRMAASGTLLGGAATLVGYGADLNGGHGVKGIDFAGDGVRQYATESVTALSRYYLHLRSITALGLSGPCVGDSGAPRLLDDESLLGAITGGIGGACQSPERAIRLDRPDVLSFLHQHVS